MVLRQRSPPPGLLVGLLERGGFRERANLVAVEEGHPPDSSSLLPFKNEKYKFSTLVLFSHVVLHHHHCKQMLTCEPAVLWCG